MFVLLALELQCTFYLLYAAFINKIIDKELASYEKKLKIDKSKVIEVKDKDKYFKLLK